jgi:hypothetical protein
VKLERNVFTAWLRRAAAALALLAPFGVVQAADEWSMEERATFAVSSALLVADWAQTRQIARNAQMFSETNPILGRHPSVGRVNAYFATALLLNYVIGRSLDSGWRSAWFVGVGSIEANVVQRNLSIGLSLSF